MSAGEGHSRSNASRTVEDALVEFSAWRTVHPDVPVAAGISAAFVCPFDGDIPANRLVELVSRFAELRVYRITVADTLGTAAPKHILRSTEQVREALPDIELALHLHDAHGRALETVTAAIESGVTRFDSAAGGYGGCPFAPGAHGNVATEHVVAHLYSRRHSTGIEPDALASAVDRMRTTLSAATPVRTPPSLPGS